MADEEADTGRSLRKATRFFSRIISDGTILKRADYAKLDQLLNGATQLGLEPDDLEIVVKLITDGLVPKSKMSKVMKCLLPNGVVPTNAIVTLLSWMNTDKSELDISSLILQWILAVLDFVENVGVMHRLYFIYFQLLKVDKLRPHAASLLSQLTRPEDVLLFRVQRLLRQRAVLGNDRSIISLLLLYKTYCPHLVTVPLPNTKPLAVRSSWWIQKIQDLKMRNVVVGAGLSNFGNPKIYWEMEDSVIIRTTARKRKRLEEYLPIIKHNQSVLLQPRKTIDEDRKPVSLETISSFENLLRAFDRLMLPGQSLTVLRYPPLHSVISTCKDTEFVNRFNYRLNAILYLDFAAYRKDSVLEHHQLFLARLTELFEFLQEGSHVVENFLAFYLSYIWNGRDHAGRILKLITRLHLRDFADMEDILVPIKKAFCSSDAGFKITIIHTFGLLLSNFANRETDRNDNLLLEFGSFFGREGEASAANDALKDLLEFVDDLCTIGLMLEDENLRLIHECLDFYKLVTRLPTKYGIPVLIVPPPIVVYSAFFSLDPYALSKVCSLLCCWNDAYVEFVRLCSDDVSRTDSIDISLFNAYISDFVDGLWRGRSFVPMKQFPTSAFNVHPSVLQGRDVSAMKSAFLLPRHPALVGLSTSFSKTEGTDADDFFMETTMRTQRTTDFRGYLQELGFSGLWQFLEKYVRP